MSNENLQKRLKNILSILLYNLCLKLRCNLSSKLPIDYLNQKSLIFLLGLLTIGFRFQYNKPLKLRCDERFMYAFTAYSCVFKELTLVGSNQRKFFENAVNARWKRLSQLSFSFKFGLRILKKFSYLNFT
jgi:hypothetical protein